MKGLYVHIPFCIKKCKYCDFNSFSSCDEEKNAYIPLLISDMKRYFGEQVDSVFIGGGTPTSLSAAQLETVLVAIRENFVLQDGCEFTVEANPKTLDKKKLETLKKYGVNRLSVGVQSFDDEELKMLGRVHTAEEAEETIRLCQGYFDNINIDLMFAIPGQTRESFYKTIKKAVPLNPYHISCYSLILEEGTPLNDEYQKGKLSLADEDAEREMYDSACDFFEKNGYYRYEISNFAKSGYESRHNCKYWDCDEYIGVGLSAHSYIGGVRFSNTDDFSSYIKGEFDSGVKEELSLEEKMSEFVFLGLRKTRGISKTRFFDIFEKNFDEVFEKPLLKFKNMGMIEEVGDTIRLLDKAVSVSNQILCEFIL